MPDVFVRICNVIVASFRSRKRSMLVIPKVRPEDGGKYECRGTGVQTGHVAISSAQVIVNSKPDNSELHNIIHRPGDALIIIIIIHCSYRIVPRCNISCFVQFNVVK